MKVIDKDDSGKVVKQIVINTVENSKCDYPVITFSGTKYEPVLILTGTDDQFNLLISRIQKDLINELRNSRRVTPDTSDIPEF